MPDKSPDYRELLDEKFAHQATLINANHKESMDSFERLEKKVDLTNGRVNKLEDEKKEYLKTRVDKDMLKTIEEKLKSVEEIVRQNLPHTIIHCPQKEEIDDLKTWKEQQNTIHQEYLNHESIKTRNWLKALNLIGTIVAILTFLVVIVRFKKDMDIKFDKVINNKVQSMEHIPTSNNIINDSLNVK